MMVPIVVTAMYITSIVPVETRLVPMVNIAGCGKRRSPGTARIQGGCETSIEEMPWMAAVGAYRGSKFVIGCTAFIVTARHAITAAHCTDRVKNLLLIFGSNLVERALRTPIVHIWISHDTRTTPRFVVPFKDIAVLFLRTPLTFNRFVRPICIADNFPTGIFPYRKAFIAGFGKLNPSTRTNKLHSAETELLTPNHCPATDERRAPLSDIEICTANNYTGPCKGDSGGPLMVEENGIVFAIGVESYSPDCPRWSNNRAIYSRLDSVRTPLIHLLQTEV